jgi:hypothetical protein
MSIQIAPTEEECYLIAIMQDHSGLDLAEFAWTDEEREDSCFRAWPFQWMWWRDDSPLQIDQSGRSIGKSVSITLRLFAFPFLHPGQEAVITAPELNHLTPVTALVEQRFYSVRLGREMLTGGRSGTTHRPFMMQFSNGSRIIGRIPQRDGRGVKGIHPLWLEMDEAQDYPGAGWTELVETLKRGHEGAVWRAHGVSRGVQDRFFFRLTQDVPGNKWRVHRYTALHRPTWTDAERQEKIDLYGSKESADYRRNILGLHGDSSSPLFVLHRLAACTDSDETSDYNVDQYTTIRIRDEELIDTGGVIENLMNFSPAHKSAYPEGLYWVGMDVGFTDHPSEILVFVEHRPKKDQKSVLKLLSRIHLKRISHDDQVRAILHIIDFYRPRAFSMDRTGLGLPLFQAIQGQATQHPEIAYVLDVIKGYNFSSKIVVDFDNRVVGNDPTNVEEGAIVRNVLEYASDSLRDLVDSKRLLLPWDTDLLGEFQGSTFTAMSSGMDQYGRQRRYNKGKFHALDAARMAALGHAQYAIEKLLSQQPMKEAPVFDFFVG